MKSRGLKLSLPIALSVVLLLLLIVPVFAQSAQSVAGVTVPQPPLAVNAVSPYSFITTTTTYQEITSGTLHGSGTGVDDANYNAVNLGFTFRFNGVNYTQIGINANGFVRMGGTAFSGSCVYTPISSSDNTNCANTIAALARDLKGNTGGSLRSELVGTAPNRVFVIQWKDFGSYYLTMPGNESYNFQIRLYETSNSIEVVYGSFTKNADNRTVQVGLRGATNADFRNLKTPTATTGDWNVPQNGTSNADTMALVTTVLPPSGLVYRFNPPPPAPDYSSSTKNVTPSGTRFSGEILTYTIGMVNTGDLTGTATVLSDPIPAGTAYVPGSAQLQGTGTLTGTGTSVDWSGSVGINERITVTFQVTLTAQTGSITNTVTITDPTALFAASKSVNTVVQIPNYSTSTKTVLPSGTRFTGEVLTYTVAIINSGVMTGTASLSDPVPAGTSYVPGSAQVVGGGTLSDAGNIIAWNGTVSATGRVTVTFNAVLTAINGSVTNTAIISDPLISAAVVKTASTVVAVPNYSTSTKVVSPQVHVGQLATYTVTLINTGLLTGTTTILTDPIPMGTSYVSGSAAVQGGGTLLADTTGITWTGSIAPNQRVTVTYQVTLTASSGFVTNTATITDPLLTTAVVKTASTALQSPIGGPDSGGYTYADSYAPGGPTFTWVFTTPASTGYTTANDDAFVQLPLGFDFRFYTGVYTQAFASTNGLMAFGSGSTAFTNAAIPSSSLPNNFATCFWDDQEIEAATAQGIWYETFGVAPNRYAVVTFVLQNRTTGAITPYEYQMILFEGTGQVLCQYRSMGGATAGDGKFATVGLENASGTIGLQYSSDKNPGPIEDNLAIRFDPGVGYATSTKTVQPTGSVSPGQVVTYTVVVANGGALTGTATLNDPIPAGTTYVPGSAALTGSGTLTATGSAVDWSGSLASGDRVTTTFQVTVTAISGAITNTVVISDPLLVAPVVRTASNSIVCNLPTGLSFTYNPLAPLTNQAIDFTGATTSGTPPFAYTWDFADGSPIGAGNPISHSYSITGTFNVTLTVTNVCGANSTSQAVTVSDAATPPSLSPLQSSSPTALGNATYFTSTLLAGSAPITYTWDFGDGTVLDDGLTLSHVYAGVGQYTVALTATNAGGTAVVTTTVDVGIAPIASFAATNPTYYPATTVFTYTGNAGTPPTNYLWSFGDGITSTLQNPSHTYAAPQPTNLYTATLNVSNAYGTAVTNTVITVLNTSADLGIAKSDSPDPVASGQPLTYTLVVSNFGPNPLVGSPVGSISFTNTNAITISDNSAATPYPSTINVAGITGVVGKVRVTLNGISHTYPSDIDILMVGPSGQSVILMSDADSGTDISNVVLTFDDAAPNSLPSSAAITSGTFKPTNYDSLDTFPAPAPTGPYGSTLSGFIGADPNGAWNLYVVDDVGGDSGAITGGWNLDFTTVTPVTTTVTDVLPAGYTFGGATGSGWTCANNSGTVTCTRGALPIGTASKIVITGNAPLLAASGNVTNTATISSALPDGNPINNTAAITTFVNASQSDLSVVKTGTPDTVPFNNTVTYFITVTNGGPDTTGGVKVVDTLPTGMTFASASGGCANSGQVVTCTIGTVNNGASASASIVVTATAYGTFTNTVTTSGDNPDIVPGNNAATAATSIVWPEISANPISFSAVLPPNKATTQTLTISNTGLVPLLWVIGEKATLFQSAYTPVPEYSTGNATEADRMDLSGADEKVETRVPDAPFTPFEPEAVLYDNGSFVNLPGGGAGGANASVLQSALGLGTYGWGHAVSSGFRVADDFIVPGPAVWNISNLTFFAYQTGSAISSTMDAVNYRIWNGVPGASGSQVIFGDTTTNRLITTTWSGAYRVLDTALSGTTRPIMADTASAGVILPPGHYWLDWQTGGTLTSGPWAIPLTISGATTTGNALQYDPTAGTWNPVTDTLASRTQGFPFIIQGTTVACSDNLPWLSANPLSGTTNTGSSSGVNLVFDSTGLTTGVYTATLCLTSNDYDTPLVQIPVSLNVKLYSVYLPVVFK